MRRHKQRSQKKEGMITKGDRARGKAFRAYVLKARNALMKRTIRVTRNRRREVAGDSVRKAWNPNDTTTSKKSKRFQGLLQNLCSVSSRQREAGERHSQGNAKAQQL